MFRKLAPSRCGVQFSYFNDGRLDRMFVVETNGAGIAWLDFDGDRRSDLYVVNGCRLPHDPADRSHLNALFWNKGQARFLDVAEWAGLDDNQYGVGVVAGDYDNDGWLDLYVCNYGTNVLYRNCGDGTFLPVAADMGAGATGWNAGAAFGDLDRDGDLDLYVTVYAVGDLKHVPVCFDSATGTHRVYCGPKDYRPARHHLFLNEGDGTFREATAQTGCDKVIGKGMGVVIVDLDKDHWPEIFVANDMTPNYLYRNRRRERGTMPVFDEVAIESGVAFDGNGRMMADMGIACGDADGDGWLDLYVTHYHQQGATLYRNRSIGSLSFCDVTAAMGLLIPSLPYLGFGCEFFDYDNDGWLDLYAVNGHVLGPLYPEAEMNPQLFHNLDGRRFEEVTARGGPYFAGRYLARGSATCDFDNDGAVDLAVVHLDEPLALLRNVASNRGRSIALALVGTRSNRDGVGAQVTVTVGDRRLVRQVLAGGSYQSAPDLRLVIGTAQAAEVDRLELVWPSGRRQSWDDLTTNCLYLLREDGKPMLLSSWGSRGPGGRDAGRHPPP